MPKLSTSAAPAQNQAVTPWRCKIDYLSFTSGDMHVIPHDTTHPHLDVADEAQEAFRIVCGDRVQAVTSLAWTPTSPRSGYTRAAQHPTGIRYYSGHAVAKPLAEIGGHACDVLNAAGVLLPMVQYYCETVTRIDLAGDLTCDILPSDFVASGFSPRYASNGKDNSATGLTEYIGSPKSDRRAKVYRYLPPHPRADALRVEVTLRRELAKSAAQELCSRSIADVWLMSAKPFSFKHPSWRTPSTSSLPRLTMKNEPTNASRLRWLIKQIKPAVLSAHAEGLIDLQEWLKELPQ